MITAKNIIIRMPNWLGDLVMATPVIADVRKKYPNARITAMCQSNVAPLLKEDPHIDEILLFHRPSGWERRHSRHVIEQIRKGHYDLGILLTNSISSAWWFWRGKVEKRLGFKRQMRSALLNMGVNVPRNIETQHLVITYKQILDPLGIPVSNQAPKLYLDESELESAQELLKRSGILPEHTLIGINPGAAYGSAKCWLPERFRELAVKFLDNPAARIVFFGDNTGAELVRDICVGLPERVVNLAGKTSIRELMALISCCSAFVTNDSGPMHIASALGTPLVALFGSTSEVKTGPYHGGTVIHKNVSCSPCYKRTCPIDFRCMKSIEVDEVLAEVQALLKSNIGSR